MVAEDGGRIPPRSPEERAAALRERWCACSSALGWAVPADWPHETVDAVCAAVAARGERTAEYERHLEAALARWAGARAACGIGLAETLSDLAALHAAVSSAAPAPAVEVADPGSEVATAAGRRRPGVRGPDGVRLLRVVSLAWTDVACGELAETAVVDPLSGLASARYLRTRLAEVYRGARARGAKAGDGYALVVITMDVRGWARVAPLTLAGNAAEVVFDAGESIAVLGRSTVVVLAPREGLAARAAVLRRLLARRATADPGIAAAPGVRIVSLPATHDGACATLERLRRAAPSATRRAAVDQPEQRRG